MKKTKMFNIIAVVLIFLGGAIFGLTAINQNFNFNKMFYEYDYQTKTYPNNLTDITSIEIDLKEVLLDVRVSEDNFQMSYNEYENRLYQITNEDNKLKISINDKMWYDYLTFKLPLNNTATIFIPISYEGQVKIFGDNVKIANELIEKITVIS